VPSLQESARQGAPSAYCKRLPQDGSDVGGILCKQVSISRHATDLTHYIVGAHIKKGFSYA